jgi:hypothetical protein
MSHPGDHRSLGPLLDRDSLRSGDRSAPDRRCVIRDRTSKPFSEIKKMKDDPAAVEKMSEQIKARYSKLFGV